MTKPRILFIDVETAPIVAYVWKLWDQNVGLDMIKSDWHLLAFCAKWADSKKLIYMDQRNAKNIEDDQKILSKVWDLLNEADIIITQNGKAFDEKKLNARFVLSGFQPPSSYKHIDTKQIASRKFGFTSNKLEYLSGRLNRKFRKQKHKRFAGFELWKECLAGNPSAWKEMEKYNKYDVLALEELYGKLAPWTKPINLGLYLESEQAPCGACGSDEGYHRNGYHYTDSSKYQRFRCKRCGNETRGHHNLFPTPRR